MTLSSTKLHYCREALLDMCDTPLRSQLRARLGLLERAAWSLSLVPATEMQVVGVARLVLDLRDEVADARAAEVQLSRSPAWPPLSLA